MHICHYLERLRSKEISIEPRVGLAFGVQPTGYTAFVVKGSIYRNAEVWFADVAHWAETAPSWAYKFISTIESTKMIEKN